MTTAYCETFDNPHPVTGRSGQMDGVLWGVSRVSSGINYDWPFGWAKTNIDACGNVQSVFPESDIQVCSGQLRESSNDNFTGAFDAGGVLALTMYPKQPFDFGKRTGTVAFDVTNDSAGTHSAWPEFWMTDLPVPNPFSHFGSWVSVPQNGFAVRFGAECQPGNACVCPTVDDHYRWTVDSAATIRDWVVEDNNIFGGSQCNDGGNLSCVQTGMKVKVLDCVRSPDITLGPNGGMNHVELKISQNQIDVYATDAGTTAPLKHIAVIEKANLTLSRGFIWIEDVHYNADKGSADRPSQKIHTFAWDNIAFDGPLLPRDLSFDVNNALIPTTQPELANGVFLGWRTSPTQAPILNSLPMTSANIAAATGAFLLFNFWAREEPSTFTYKINGVTNTAPWPFPDKQSTPRTIALPLPVSQLVPGMNAVSIASDKAMLIVNVSVNLVSADGVVNPPSR